MATFCFHKKLPDIPIPEEATICENCYVEANKLITFFDNLDNDHKKSTYPKGFRGVLEWMKEKKEREEKEEKLNEKLDFLGGFFAAVKEGIHPDIQVKPGNGPSLPAHRALLAIRSVIFKNMLESDGCKAAPDDTISLPELDHEELEYLLEFLYSGNLAKEKIEKHVYTLSIAADKYDIPYLQKFCERQMLESLDSSNVLEVLEISYVCSNNTLKEAAMNFVVKHRQDIIFSPRYAEFATKNPHLTNEIVKKVENEESGERQ